MYTYIYLNFLNKNILIYLNISFILIYFNISNFNISIVYIYAKDINEKYESNCRSI